MKRSERDEWTAALRSGEFEQGEGALDRNGKQCCLGVKCLLDIRAGRYNLAVETFPDNTLQNSEFYGDSSSGGRLRFTTMPSMSLLDQWGLPYDQCRKLASMNDGYDFNGLPGKQYNFSKIANWIDRNVPVEED